MCGIVHQTPGGRATITILPHGEDPIDENNGIEISGRYESTDRSHGGLPAPGLRYTCQINRAGLHIEGWMQLNQSDDTGRGTILRGRFSGDRDIEGASPNRYVIQLQMGREQLLGAIEVTRGPAPRSAEATTLLRIIAVRRDDAATPATTVMNVALAQVSAMPRIADAVIQELHPALRPYVSARETSPLDSTDVRVLENIAQHVQAVVRRGFEASADFVQRAEVVQLDAYIQHEVRKIASDKHLLVPRAMLALLHQLTENGSPLVHWAQRMVNRFDADSPALQAVSGLHRQEASVGERRYRYEYAIWGFGAFAELVGGVTARVGRFAIRRLADDGTIMWSHTLSIAYGGITYGPAISVSVAELGTFTAFETSDEWTPASFAGPCMLDSTQVSFAIVTYTLSASRLTIEGTGRFAPLVVPMEGLSVLFGAGIGFDASVLFGVIGTTEDEARHAIVASRRPPPESVHYRTAGEARVLFGIDDDVICPDAMDTLRSQLAIHQLAFQFGTASILVVVGHASPTGPESNNVGLSARRANALWRTVRHILGPNLGIQQDADHLRISYEGSREAVLHVRRGTEAAEWRRASLVLDGRAVLVMN